MTRSGLLVGLCLALQALPARAQPPDPSAEIVVTGAKPNYARTVTDVSRITRSPEDVFARFETPVCPLALGLPFALARAVESEMAQAARKAGVRIAPAGCRPNLTLVVADDGVGAIRAIQHRMPNLFQTLSGAELSALKGSAGPAWTWYEYDQKRRDGGPVEHASLLGGSSSPHAYINRNVSMSRLSETIRLDLMLAFVVVDSRAAQGLTVRQLADGAAMMGLSMVKAAQVPKLGHASALQLFTDPAARGRIAGLTDFDRAYLSTLYSGEPGVAAERRAADIAARVLGRLPPPRNRQERLEPPPPLG